MPTENYYQLLGVDPSASEEEIKRAFRQQITRYHPDKVQHLGKEFQAMAATRAAELTTAYTVLSDAGRRAEYDRTRQQAVGAPQPPSSPGRKADDPSPRPSAPSSSSTSTPPGGGTAPPSPAGSRFEQERLVRDEVVRKATIGQLRQGLTSVSEGTYDDAVWSGFDVAATPKAKLFRKPTNPAVLGRYVDLVDGRAIAEAWDQAAKWPAGGSTGVCVFLVGSSIAPVHELADAITEQRRRGRSGNVTIIAVNARDWKAHVPTDAPALAKSLVAHLQRGGRR